jgi:uncharacterized protein YggE
MRHSVFAVGFVLATQLSAANALGQVVMMQGTVSGPPSVSVTGTGEVTLPPDRAVLRFSVQGMGPSATEASAQITQRLAAITDSLRRRGLPTDSVQQMGLFIGPNAELVGQFRRPTDYSARTEVRVTLRKLGDLSGVVDAVLSAGAMELAGVQYSSDRADDANRDALRQAFTKARASAEALAAAAGRRLGELSWMSTNAVPNYSYMETYSEPVFMTSGRPLRVTPREVVVRAAVQALWKLEPR